MSSMAAVEREALDAIETRLTSAGYRLVRRPDPLQLPDFLRDASPDAIALGGPPNLLIEVLRRPAFDDAHVETGKIGKIKSSLAGHPDWRLEVVLARHSVTAPRAASVAEIALRLDEVRRLSASEPSGALLLAWSLLEAAVRALKPESAQPALSPGSMIELAVSLGYLSQADGEALRHSARRTNAIAHGDLSSPATTEEVAEVLDRVATLAAALRERGL